MYTLQERIGSLRSQLSFKQENEEEWKEENECEKIRKAWLKDFPNVFKEDLTIEDRIEMDPVKVQLVEDHENIEVYHPKACNEVPAYLKMLQTRNLVECWKGAYWNQCMNTLQLLAVVSSLKRRQLQARK